MREVQVLKLFDAYELYKSLEFDLHDDSDLVYSQLMDHCPPIFVHRIGQNRLQLAVDHANCIVWNDPFNQQIQIIETLDEDQAFANSYPKDLSIWQASKPYTLPGRQVQQLLTALGNYYVRLESEKAPISYVFIQFYLQELIPQIGIFYRNILRMDLNHPNVEGHEESARRIISYQIVHRRRVALKKVKSFFTDPDSMQDCQPLREVFRGQTFQPNDLELTEEYVTPFTLDLLALITATVTKLYEINGLDDYLKALESAKEPAADSKVHQIYVESQPSNKAPEPKARVLGPPDF